MLNKRITMTGFHLIFWTFTIIGFTLFGEYTTENTAEVETGTGQETKPRNTAFPLSGIEKRLRSLRWIAFSPTNWDPDKGVRPSLESLKEDLRVLRPAGFDALVTYGADVLDPQLAVEMKFKGMILGVWNPENKDELKKAKMAAANDIVIGFAVGNEGLDVRYDYKTLKKVVEELKATTGKPVTTSEQIEDYHNQKLLMLGDWIFAIVHPYWHHVLNPQDAVAWTQLQYQRLVAKAPNRVIFLKEVGLPSGGNPNLSEVNQAEYYQQLQESNVLFCWFEAYDQPWKERIHSIESHWGLFRSDRTPKVVVSVVGKMKNE